MELAASVVRVKAVRMDKTVLPNLVTDTTHNRHIPTACCDKPHISRIKVYSTHNQKQKNVKICNFRFY